MRTLLLAALLGLTVLAAPAQARPVKFVADIDFAPYSMLIDGAPAGIDVELLQAAADKAGVTIDIELKPLDQVLRMLKDGSCDGAFALFRNPERDKIGLFMEASPVHSSDFVLFTKVGDTFPFGAYDDLKGKTVGRVQGTFLGEAFADAASAGLVAVKDYPDLSSSLRGLIMDETQAFAGNIDVTYYRLKAMGMTSSITYLSKKLVDQQPAYLAMSRAADLPEKEDVLQRLGEALDQMRRDGAYNKIARRYLFRY
ncbi:transporter substrate-binding domain-containing protein [Pseudodesulfovibrio sp.]|uniref:substrate-binding periplasmic protein n=1 Tax=Pseudodesulfovibrio sp. TaxID=2035812 RepID=UPI0026180C8D|nr:transporter substrate-binding domain-containing protein [Pseudodesulfovibrio sp.]MDD3310536.1 transporter substrate-binding domain-containing protein [Pseudodesulfovibrio sp.]